MRYYEVTGQGPNGPTALVVPAYDIYDAVTKAGNHGLYSTGITSVRLVPAPPAQPSTVPT